MAETKYFELLQADSVQAYMIMQMVSSRCAGQEKDPESGQDWSSYENVDISIVRSSKPMPEAMDKHNVVSNLVFEFTVQELADDYTSEECNPYVEQIGAAVKRLPIGHSPSHFFLKVVLE